MRVTLTEQEWDHLIRLSTAARNTPVILLGGKYDMAGAAHSRVQQEWDRLGQQYGFRPLTLRNCDETARTFDADAAPPSKEPRP